MMDFDIHSLKGLTQDSRAVKRGYLFAALPGSKTDGLRFIPDALRNGAAALLIPADTVLPEGLDLAGVHIIRDPLPQRRLAQLAAAFYGRQPSRIVTVTGTNGKTSTVHFVKQLWAMQGLKAASIGTLGVRMPGAVRSGSMTTPDPVSLHAELADLAAVGVTHLAMEASSHGLDQYRLDGVSIAAAGFTNLTRDHLDYHGDMESYWRAKQRLFTDLLPAGGAVVLNADVPEYAALAAIAQKRSLKIISYGHQGRDLTIRKAEPAPQGIHAVLDVMGCTADITLPLVGDFQVMNVLCALGLVLAEAGQDPAAHLARLPDLQGVPGRLQLVPGHPSGAAVYIDYAHTPDALENILKALRKHTEGRLICLFGCGGDRDRGKRPLMGQIASENADVVIVTDDNPRSEKPAAIRKEILAGVPGAREIGDRRAAIRSAVEDLRPGDILVIAGKGHEQGQIFADRTEPFDDFQEAHTVIKELA